jgi:hypothetical protein
MSREFEFVDFALQSPCGFSESLHAAGADGAAPDRAACDADIDETAGDGVA